MKPYKIIMFNSKLSENTFRMAVNKMEGFEIEDKTINLSTVTNNTNK